MCAGCMLTVVMMDSADAASSRTASRSHRGDRTNASGGGGGGHAPQVRQSSSQIHTVLCIHSLMPVLLEIDLTGNMLKK